MAIADPRIFLTLTFFEQVSRTDIDNQRQSDFV